MKVSIALSSAALASCFAASSSAALTQWRVEDGGNGHYYDIIVTPLQSWVQSKAQAEAMGGYLASITSAEENAWLWSAFNIGGTPAYWAQTGPWPGYDGPVFGAYRDANNVWSWVSGEAWGWSNFNWSMGSGEAGAQFIANSPYWDDIGIYGGTSAGGNYSFVVEFNSNPVPAPGAMALLALAARVTHWGHRTRRRRLGGLNAG
jgi:hypothetical protein